MSDFDATIVGSGPNGLAAAVELARNGRKVLVVEGSDEIGGGTRTKELTLPGFRHDVCSAIHPSGIASPFFREIGLDVDWIHPSIPFTHPLDGGRAVALHRSVEETARQFPEDAPAYRRIMGRTVDRIEELLDDFLGPVTLTPRHPRAYARFGLLASMPATWLSARLESEEARALLGGLAAHSIAPLSSPGTAGPGLLLGALGHSHGWPMARGGSQSVANALAGILEGHGGVIETQRMIRSIEELPGNMILMDVMPPAAQLLAGRPLRGRRSWRPGPGIFKIDWALDAPIPWADSFSPLTSFVHVGGTFEEVRDAEAAVVAGDHPRQPFVLLAQQSLFDHTRAPEGKHTAWGYCHVPNGSTVDMTEAIENQIERFAPGFREAVSSRSTMSTTDFESYNPNFMGGDIGGGRYSLRKVLQLGDRRPYELGPGLYLCSSATPPGAGVHGMCGYYAARAALAEVG